MASLVNLLDLLQEYGQRQPCVELGQLAMELLTSADESADVVLMRHGASWLQAGLLVHVLAADTTSLDQVIGILV